MLNDVIVDKETKSESVQETEVIENITSDEIQADLTSEIEEKITEQPVELINYLDTNIINDVKTLTFDELSNYDKEEEKKSNTDFYLDSVLDIKEGEVVDGTVVNITDREVYVDIGFKSEGLVHKNEFDEMPAIGDSIKVFIVNFEDHKGHFVLSKEKADFIFRWKELNTAFETDEIIKGVILKRIKGGMVVDLNGVFAFLPGSQIDVRPVTNFDDYIGEEFEFKIVKVNETRKNIVISRKVILEVDMQEKRQEIINQLEQGMVLEGVVKNITDFGAFIDLGGIDGLLHITDISWGRVNHPSEVLEIDSTITVKVIDFDVEKVRVSLGMKQLEPEPWEGALEKYPVDEVVSGKIVNMMNYGVFVELEQGIEGLIHVSEMSWTRHIKNPNELYKLGDEVEAKILSIDTDEKKISLGIKQLTPNPWDDIEKKYPVGSVHKGVIRNLTQFGAFIALEEGIDGLVHISDLSWLKNVRHPKDILQKGNDIEVKILEVSGENHRLSLGVKQIEDDPWPEMKTIFTSGKEVEGTVLRVLDKGIILNMEHDLEGIVPLKRIPKQNRTKIKSKFKPGDVCTLIVQEIDQESKKIILMLDDDSMGMEDFDQERPNKTKQEHVEPEDKIEIPQEIIDNLSETKES